MPARPRTSTGKAGPALSNGVAAIVDEAAHAAPHGAGDQHVADLERAALDQHRRHRAAALVELGFDHHAVGGAIGIGLELEHFGLQQDRFLELVEVGPLGRRDLDRLDFAAQLLDLDLVAAAVRSARGSGSAPGLSILLMATMIGTPAALAWAIASLVCGMTPSSAGHDQHDDVGHLGAARAHGGEGLVARRVEEGDLLLDGRVT